MPACDDKMGRVVVIAMMVQKRTGDEPYMLDIEIVGLRMGKCG
jgi:hypothetical protein